MKKLLAFLLTAFLIVASFSMVASAGSPETNGPVIDIEGIDSDNVYLGIKLTNTTSQVKDSFQKEVNKQNTNDKKTYTILDVLQITLDKYGDETGDNNTLLTNIHFPVSLTFKVTGVTEKDSGFFLFMNENGKIEKIPAKFSNGTMTGKFSGLGKVALVVNKTTDNKGNGTSPQTSDNATPIVYSILFASVIAAGCLIKKIRTEA